MIILGYKKGFNMLKRRSQFVIVSILTVFFASCGGGSGSGSETLLPSSNDDSTELPTDNTHNSGEDIADVPSSGEPIGSTNHILGPKFGDELSIYHATLVMKVLRFLSFAEDGFAGVPYGVVVNGMTDYYEQNTGSGSAVVPNGGLVPCLRDGESHGNKSVTWDNGGDEYPAQYTSTRMYSNCRHSGLNFGRFKLYDGVLQQSGIALSGIRRHDIQAGRIDADQLTIGDLEEDVSVTIDGNMSFNSDASSQRVINITDIDLTFYEDNSTFEGAERYVEEIFVHDGTVTFERLMRESAVGTSYLFGVKHASLKIDVKNNNHQNMVLWVKTVETTSDDVFYSLEIQRGENSADPQSTDHVIRIDRVNSSNTVSAVYNVSIDFNHNGVIDGIGAYPKEFYEEERLFRDRWGYITGL
jgi:hypothetical protein